MLVNLANLDTGSLDLKLSPPGTPPDLEQLLNLTQIRGLGGELSQMQESLRLSGVSVQAACVEALRLLFGSVVVVAGGKTELRHGVAHYSQEETGLKLDVVLGTLVSPRLEVHVGSVSVVGNTRLEEVELRVHGGEGRIQARSCKFGAFLLSIGTVRMAVPELEARDLDLTWGARGFELEAKSVHCNSLDFETPGTKIRGASVRADRLRIHDADWSLSKLTLDRASAEMDLVVTPTEVPAQAVDTQAASAPPLPTEPAGEAKPEAYVPDKPIFDWRILDQVSGRFDADVGVDVKLPVIRSRRAVHQFRITIDQGTLNYRELEHDLSTLEDALLDFSVRENDLVLELGVPLLPTRGHGKPLIRWPLSPEELLLASEQRVRLATLAHPKLASESDAPPANDAEPDQTQESAVQLRKLAFENIDASLALRTPSAPMNALLRSIRVADLSLTGSVVHDALDAATTRLAASMHRVDIDLDDFPLTGRKFDLKAVSIERIGQLNLDLLGVKPVKLSLELEMLTSKSVDFGVFADD